MREEIYVVELLVMANTYWHGSGCAKDVEIGAAVYYTNYLHVLRTLGTLQYLRYLRYMYASTNSARQSWHTAPTGS